MLPGGEMTGCVFKAALCIPEYQNVLIISQGFSSRSLYRDETDKRGLNSILGSTKPRDLEAWPSLLQNGDEVISLWGTDEVTHSIPAALLTCCELLWRCYDLLTSVLPSMGLQRVGHDLATKQQPHNIFLSPQYVPLWKVVGLCPEKVGKPEPTNWSLVSPFPRQTHLTRDFTFYTSHRFSVLGRQTRNQTSRTRVLGLRWCTSIEHCRGQRQCPLGRTWTQVSGDNLFPFDFLEE